MLISVKFIEICTFFFTQMTATLSQTWFCLQGVVRNNVIPYIATAQLANAENYEQISILIDETRICRPKSANYNKNGESRILLGHEFF